MKSVEYVNRFGEGVCNNDYKAVQSMFDMLVSEFNGQARHRHILKENTVEVEKLIGEFNRKGRVIAELFERKYGKPVLQRDWFRNAVVEIRKGSGETE